MEKKKIWSEKVKQKKCRKIRKSQKILRKKKGRRNEGGRGRGGGGGKEGTGIILQKKKKKLLRGIFFFFFSWRKRKIHENRFGARFHLPPHKIKNFFLFLLQQTTSLAPLHDSLSHPPPPPPPLFRRQ